MKNKFAGRFPKIILKGKIKSFVDPYLNFLLFEEGLKYRLIEKTKERNYKPNQKDGFLNNSKTLC